MKTNSHSLKRLLSFALIMTLLLTFPTGIAAKSTSQDDIGLETVRVQVLTGGEVQSKYRNAEVYDVGLHTVYKGDHAALAVNGEDPDLYYTTSRIASMTDPRIFTMKLTLPKGSFTGIAGEGDNPFDIAKVRWAYNGSELTYAANPQTHVLRGVNTVGTAKVTMSGDNIVVVQEIKFNAFTSQNNSAHDNRPYLPYYPMRHLRAEIPYVGDWLLEAFYGAGDGAFSLGSKTIRLSENDAFLTYDELDAFIKGYNTTYGEAGGTVYSPKGRYLRFESLGKSAEGRDLWAAVISDSKASVDEYLSVTKPRMNESPELMIGEVAGGDQKGVLFFSTIHGDEQTGPAVSWTVMDRLLSLDKLRFTRRAEENTERIFPTYIDDWSGGSRRVDPGNPGTPEDVALDVDEFLEKYIVVLTFHGGPDGYYHSYWGSAYNYDLNRDASYFSQLETRAAARAFNKWDPIYMVEFHGYYDNYVIDGTTPPYEPNLEVDLINEYMTPLCDALGMSIIGNSAHKRYNHPTRDVVRGWDSGSTVYTPTMSMLFGSLGTTIEFPNSTQDSVDAGVQGVLGLFQFCLDERDGLYSNKVEFKRRGKFNEDRKDLVDPLLTSIHPFIEEVRNELDAYFLTNSNASRRSPVPENVLVGRPRKVDSEGNAIQFFPEYFIVPVDHRVQRSPGDAYEALDILFNLGGVKLERTNGPITYSGVEYPEGTYIVNMHQAARTFANVILYDGYDASVYESLYDSIVVSYPQLRGFECVPVYEKGVFEGKTSPADLSADPASFAGTDTYVIVKNNSADAIRLVNRLLKDSVEVRMVDGYFKGASIGDFVTTAADAVNKATAAENLILGNKSLNVNLIGCGNQWPYNAKKIVKPNVGYGAEMGQYNSRSNHLLVQYFLDLFEFEDIGEITVNAARNNSVAVGTRDGANVYLLSNARPGGDLLDAINGGAPVILVGGVNPGGANVNAIISEPENRVATVDVDGEALLRATYSGSSLILSNMQTHGSVYSMNNALGVEPSPRYLDSLPGFLKPIVVVSDEADYFIAGKVYPKGSADVYKGKAMVAAGVYEKEGTDIPITVIVNNVFGKAAGQLYYRIIANALLANASGIDLNPAYPGKTVFASLSVDPESDIDKDVEFTLCLSGAENVLSLELEFEVDGNMLAGKGVETLAGFTAVDSIVWRFAGGSTWKATVTLGYPAGSDEGFNADSPEDVAKFMFAPRAKGDAAMVLTGFRAVGLEGDVTVYLDSVISGGEAVTNIDQRVFSKYDLNRDNKVDALDLGIMLLYCGFDIDSADWDTLVKVNDSKGKPVTASMCDVNGDGVIDMLDLLDLFIHYTK